ncbi:4-hydroxythreonine-4-phosphate dehydrogenase [Rhodovastum atsumiense]|uniref:4-hydroxythreonine-4-phosphate dehydrogenase n=1 Tax=Rhodovastum atsumiense TaxID=504468 RepID=A0A5M6IQD6_9PROT|nr:4-hydroxythreonine-4-phosphate dehydrogenase PdxA [Rhodovastum atsumiense]KAA5610492.1 4-hydroxythreonine-4-phosphate dehydrogenase PdxA [Rhodovastum atsumiense]CAH2600479.1 4-hydroxythreonine-4-phosphate dehydrogenase [Rhodovastum atsumiense]
MTMPLALTMGDPAGIGGELTLKAWLARRHAAPFVALDDPGRLQALARKLSLDVPIREVPTIDVAAGVFRDALPVFPVPLGTPPVPGTPDPANAAAVIASIEQATRLTLAGEAAAVVTNPIHKSTLYGVGFPHPGHTEFLAALTGTALPVMMLASPVLRVVPVTVHASLRRMLEMITVERIVAVCRVTDAALRAQWGIPAPRLALAGLNPHAGEDGTMGEEEILTIAPAIAQLRAEGIDAFGPFAADSMFTPTARAGYDVAMGMYHDQALIPLKTLDMAQGVNVTLGLPVVRTSPDHGTAFAIAGQGRADPSSLIAAIDLAADLASRKEATA